MRPIHVLVLPSWYPTVDSPLNGIFFKGQARALQRAGLKVTVAYNEARSLRTFKPSRLADYHFQTQCALEDGIPTIRRLGWNLPHFHEKAAANWVKNTVELVHKSIAHYGRPDVIHAHSVLWAGYAAMLVSEKWKVPYIITEHSSDYLDGSITPWKRKYVSRALVHADKVVSVGSQLKLALASHQGYKTAEIEVIPNMVDTDYFTLPNKTRTYQTFRFLSVGFLTPIKGMDLLLRAFAQAFNRDPKVFLDIGGDGEERKKLEDLALELGISSRVRFLGLLHRDGVKEAMWNAHAFISSSLYETFGVVLIEALATGLPLIATRSGGPADIVQDENGILVPPGEVETLAEAMRKLYENRERYDAELLRRYAIERYGELSVVQRLSELYQDAIIHNTSLDP